MEPKPAPDKAGKSMLTTIGKPAIPAIKHGDSVFDVCVLLCLFGLSFGPFASKISGFSLSRKGVRSLHFASLAQEARTQITMFGANAWGQS